MPSCADFSVERVTLTSVNQLGDRLRGIPDEGQPLISVLIPAYNVEEDVGECIKSVRRQTYANLEIVIVDDGSTDGTCAICQAAAAEDPRISVYSQTNQGLAQTRNVLLSHASGSLIAFVDSDDYISNQYIEQLFLWLVQEDVDISICGRCRVIDGTITPYPRPGFADKRLTAIEALRALNSQNSFDVSSYSKLYKRHVFDGITYPPGRISEDAFVAYKIIFNAGYVYYKDEPLYFYRQRGGSITMSDNVSSDYARAAEEQAAFFRDRIPELRAKGESAAFMAHMTVFNTFLSRKVKPNQKTRQFIRQKSIRRLGYVLANSDVTFGKKIQSLLFAFVPRLYSSIYPRLKNR